MQSRITARVARPAHSSRPAESTRGAQRALDDAPRAGLLCRHVVDRSRGRPSAGRSAVAMIKVPVAGEEPQATVMNCEDARDGLSALIRGHIGLTEWALLEAHVKQCADCRQAEVRLRQQAAASRPVTRPRAVLASLREAMELARIGVPCSAALVVRRRALLTAAARDLAPRATAGLMRAIGRAGGYSADLMARIRVSLATAHALAARTFASASQAFGRGITRSVAEVAHLRASLAIPLRSSVAVADALEVVRLGITRSVKRTMRFRPSLTTAGVVLALAVTLYALQGTDGPQELARPPAPPRPQLLPTPPEPPQVESARLEPTPAEPPQAEPAPLAPAPPAPSAEKKIVSGAPPLTDERRQAPPPTLLPELPVSAVHVVGRLSAKSPGAAQRDFVALLADVGGTELSRSQRVRFTAIEVIVPQARYSEFADGLARIGSWRLEAARFPLPDAVHMTIRVSE